MNNLTKTNTCVAIEKVFNIFTSHQVRTTIPADGKPVAWKVPVNDPKSDVVSILFEPTYYITPIEKIIQRVVLGIVAKKFDMYQGHPQDFPNTRFYISTREIADLIPKKFTNDEIKKAVKKQFKFIIDVKLKKKNGKGTETHTSTLLHSGVWEDLEDCFSFKPSILFQQIRKETLRSSVVQKRIGGMNYIKIRTDLTNLVNYPKPEMQFLLFINDFFENTHLQQKKPKDFVMDTKFYQSLLNTRKITGRQKRRTRETIKKLNETDDFKDCFIIQDTGKEQDHILTVVF